jgi:hypothetical protein
MVAPPVAGEVKLANSGITLNVRSVNTQTPFAFVHNRAYSV